MLLRVNYLMIIVLVCLSCYFSHELSTINKSKPLINAHATLECHRREYTFKATRTDLSGRQCWEYITVMSCWGRCDSGEVCPIFISILNIHLFSMPLNTFNVKYVERNLL